MRAIWSLVERLDAVEAALAEFPLIEEKREAQAQNQQKNAKPKEVRAARRTRNAA